MSLSKPILHTQAAEPDLLITEHTRLSLHECGLVLAEGEFILPPPIPAVIASFSLGAFCMRSAVRYAGQKGVVMSCSSSLISP